MPLLLKISHFISEHLAFIGVSVLIFLGFWGVRGRKEKSIQGKIKRQDAVRKSMDEPNTLHPEIDPTKCAGCGACVSVCPEGEILQLINHKAVLVSPTKCVGHGVCEVVCPFEAITLVFGTKTKGMELPRLTENYESDVNGLYIAGELGGMGLISNAVKQAKMASEHAIQNLNKNEKTDYDIFIVGAGPAGLSASLACTAKKQKYLCIDQDKFGGTIYSFPRQKIVMQRPVDFPLAGLVKFSKHKISKEELLSVWGQIRTKFKLNIKEGVKFTGLKRKGKSFLVETSGGNYTAKKVILCLGVRGTPRKLDVPGEDLPKVTYNLLEPEQYQRRYIAVVGAGNSALEAAQYLARSQYRNKVILIVRGDNMSKANDDNIRLVLDLQRKGLLKIWYKSSIKEIQKEAIQVKKGNELIQIPNHYVFIFVGALMPFKFLEGIGIKIEKKFGEARIS